ncbi:triose-phosphate isomerase [Thermocladium modestius]|uniref:Triosephosphate isomerase n=2 Tax=Thermocladium modestius TaxID=62609 RepID=A0A830GX07_9CREN|nr:triose-phosphate isomerase [Thermocladium modestius]
MKAYQEVVGEGAIQLAKAADEVSRETGASIAVAPPLPLLKPVVEAVEIEVFAQSADPVRPGAATGFTPLEMIKEAGARGVILNHSEHRLLLNDLSWMIGRARDLGLDQLVCAPDPETSAAAAALSPTAIAVEPPELIGTGKAVSKERPEVISRTVELVSRISKGVHVITGAGIESGSDVSAALSLGTQGVLVASAIVKARNWRDKITELALPLLGKR